MEDNAEARGGSRREYMRLYMRERRAVMTDDERAAHNEERRQAYHARIAAMSPDEYAEFRSKCTRRALEWWNGLEGEQLASRKAMQKSQNRCRGKAIKRAELEALLAANDGTCDVCGRTIPQRRDGGDGRHVDHRHDNGAVRGILCARCNSAMHAVDQPELLAKLIEYSKRGQQVE